MPRQPIEITLRIPRVKEPLKSDGQFPLNNDQLRFLKVISVEALPKVGETITLTIQPDEEFTATVARAEWDDEKQMFAAACRYTQRSIPQRQYLAIMHDAEWKRKTLF